MGRAVTFTREQRMHTELMPMDHVLIGHRCDAIVAEDYDAVVEGLFLPIIAEDLFSAYLAVHGIESKLKQTESKFRIFRRKKLKTWRLYHSKSTARGIAVVSRMMLDLLDAEVTGHRHIRVTRKAVNAARIDRA